MPLDLDPDVDRQVQRVAGRDAAQLVEGGATVLDVRTPDEFTGLGHIPGARLLPVHLSTCAPAMLDPDAPVLVCCEHAVRSRFTARLLAQAGFTRVYELADGMAAWTGRRAFSDEPIFGPSSWLVENVDLLPSGGQVLDVACGNGRHALLLAAAGFDVTAIDRDSRALARLKEQADRLGLAVRTEEMDLEASDVDLGLEPYDLIVVTRYLHRPLVPRLTQAVAPDGLLIYETFLAAQAQRGHPTNPAFLLEPGELRELVRPLDVVRAREGEHQGAMLSAIVARRSPTITVRRSPSA